MEIKLDLEFASETKSVAAMCLSNWTINLMDWSNEVYYIRNMFYSDILH